jgi:serine/threonine-protein kinase
VPPVFADGARAWRGNHPDHDDVEIRVRGATLGGRVVQFQVEHGWHAPAVPPSLLRRINAMVINLLVIGLLVGAVFLARANVRQGRGDLKGAKRFAGCILLLFVLWWALGAAHASGGTVFVQLLVRVGLGLLQAGAIWGVYLALEPFVRRRWPDLLVSWTRLLDGRWRDPLVGRDLVLGSALAMALVLLDGLTVAAPAFVGGQVPYLQPPLDPLLGGRLALAGIAQFQLTIFVAMLILLVLTLARFVLKRDWAAFVTAALFSTAVFLGNAVNANLQTVFLLVFAVLFVALLMRFGLLAGMVALVVHAPLAHTAVTVDFGSWHADPTLYAVGLVVVVTLYGFVVSFGGRSMLGDPVLDDS